MLIVAAPVAKNHNFGQILTFWALLYRTPFTNEGQSCVLEQTQGLRLHAKFYLNVFIVSAPGVQKPQFWVNFDNLGAPVPTPFYR